jgi:hypothetical protein
MEAVQMIWIVATLAWGFVVSLIGGLVALALNKWAAGWSLATRVFVAVAASISPSFGIVGYFLAKPGRLYLWVSSDEFALRFGLHVLVIVAVSTPIAWLLSRRAPRKPVPTDAFD